MYYSELVNFDSLESVIQLKEADQTSKAKQLITSYVISEEMANRLIHFAFVQLQIHQPSDNKGLFIVGNYGTGKSHLMAVISSLAENADFVTSLTHPKVVQAARAFAGRFYVLRTEIGATTRPLRDILTHELETYLNKMGITFTFPSLDMITNNKEAFEAMMRVFEQYHPDLGLLVVVDELLEYLRSRKDQELILDLNFLREIGEVCKNTRFRFIAGIQETVFDNPRFEFVASSLRRVKDRFEQLLITREDIKYVIAERLLKKNESQRTQIKNYLHSFSSLYGNFIERLEEFCTLFPVHPDYIETFERITLIEKREVLKTLERGVQILLHQTLSSDVLYLLTYDSYWLILRQNPSFRTLPEIREVIECSQVLENRVQQAFTLPLYKPMALRIIHALSVHRLTTHDIYAPVGVTAQELRDTLCLYQSGITELGGHPADDLLSLIETVLREILKTVNRQFISSNPLNGQYYLDVKKNYDFDAIIEKRVESLENYQLDRSYYIALKQLLELAEPHDSKRGLSWSYELEWCTHRVTRMGYLFFGAPNERATALPPQEFYLYFLQPYEPPLFKDSQRANELFFRLTAPDDSLTRWLKFHAAAKELMSTSSGHPQAVYESKMQSFLREILQWLRNHMFQIFETTYRGHARCFSEDIKPKDEINFRDTIEEIANRYLEPYFSDLAPQYPIFPVLISRDNLTYLAQEALQTLDRPTRNKAVNGLLEGLQLLEAGQVTPYHSPYAQAILELLHQKPPGYVLNRSELLQIDTDYFAPETYRLEPELVMVLLAVLVYAREIVLVVGGQPLEASNFDVLASLSIHDLLYFKHIERPKGFNIPALKALFELLDLPEGLEHSLTQGEEQVVRQFQNQGRKLLQQLGQAQQFLVHGIFFWGKALFNETDIHAYRETLLHLKNFLESLQIYTSPTKFKNFRYTPEEIKRQKQSLETLHDLNHFQMLLIELNPAVTYLMAGILPPDHEWMKEMSQQREDILSQLIDTHQRNAQGFIYPIKQKISSLQKNYAKAYLKLHHLARLGPAEEKERTRLSNDPRLLNLRKLAHLNFMPRHQLQEFENQLTQLETCFSLSEYDLLTYTQCPHCGFKPSSENYSALSILAQLNKKLRLLYHEWTQIVITELNHATPQRELLKPQHQLLIENFLTQAHLPEEISQDFLEAIQEGLMGLVKVTFNFNELYSVLAAGGAPITMEEIQKRFNKYLATLTQGKQLNKVRIVLDDHLK